MPTKRRCVSCRASQRSCDTKRPACARCLSKAIKCVYPDTPKFSFVDQNNFSAELSRRAASRSVRERTRVEFEVIIAGVSDDNLGSKSQALDAPTLCQPLLWSLEDRVLNRFFMLWTGGYTCLGCFDVFPKVYRGSGESSATKSAVLTVAYADLALLECHGDYVDKSYEAYTSTLRRIQDHLRDSSAAQVATDNILTSILVIDSVELLYMRRPASSGSHTAAIVRFLQLRRKEGRFDRRSVEMWRAAYPRLQARQILCGLPSYDNSIGYMDMLDNNRLDRHVASFVASACDVMHILRSMLDRATHKPNTDRVLAQHSVNLQTLLQKNIHQLEHDDTLPKMQEQDIPSPLHPYWPDKFVRSRVLISGRFWIARDWILFHMCRIKILDVLMDVGDHLTRHSHAACPQTAPPFTIDKELAVSDLDESCQILLDIMPFLMGLTNGGGENGQVHFKDTGLLIAHYPLWTIKQSKYAWSETRENVEVLLRFFETYRSISGRSSSFFSV